MVRGDDFSCETPSGRMQSFVEEVHLLMTQVILEDVSNLWARGERYPIAVVLDGSSRAAQRLKQRLPPPADECPHNPGLFAGYGYSLGRQCLQEVLGIGDLLDDPGDAPPGCTYWKVLVLRNRLAVYLITLKGGQEVVLRNCALLIEG